jgi:hypothetical protein
MPVQVVLAEYLERLRKEQESKPLGERLMIPTIKQFASEAGISRPAFSDFANDKNQSINKQLVDTTIRVLRSLGHSTKIDDVITYREIDEAH